MITVYKQSDAEGAEKSTIYPFAPRLPALAPAPIRLCYIGHKNLNVIIEMKLLFQPNIRHSCLKLWINVMALLFYDATTMDSWL